jgi:hypothetical protein
MSIVKCTLHLTCRFIDLKNICRKKNNETNEKKLIVSYM